MFSYRCIWMEAWCFVCMYVCMWCVRVYVVYVCVCAYYIHSSATCTQVTQPAHNLVRKNLFSLTDRQTVSQSDPSDRLGIYCITAITRTTASLSPSDLQVPESHSLLFLKITSEANHLTGLQAYPTLSTTRLLISSTQSSFAYISSSSLLLHFIIPTIFPLILFLLFLSFISNILSR